MSGPADLVERHEALLRGLLVACDAGVVAEFVSPRYQLFQEVIAPLEAGERGIRTFTWFFGRGLEARQLTVDASVAEEDRVACRFSGSAVHAASLGALPPTGRELRVTGLAVSRAVGGVFTSTRLAVSDADALRQLGFLKLRSWVDERSE